MVQKGKPESNQPDQRTDPFALPPDLETLPEHQTPRPDPDTTGISVARKSQASKDHQSFPRIDGYQINRKLGQGGMGSVYLATDLRLGRHVAIKVIAQSFRDVAGLRERFDAEIKVLASLQHAHIAQLHSAGHCDGLPYFVMEYVEGPTLDEYSRNCLKPAEAARIGIRLCEAVAWCHAKGVLHRDLKPSNVLMHEGSQPKIADFGLAKAIGSDTSSTRTGEILGTPGYMAPEQASGVVKGLTPACDIYALGAILYRILTGRPPFVAAEPFQTVLMVLSEDPVRPRKLIGGIPVDLETICLKCLEKKPHRRYESANALQEDLQRFLAGHAIAARRASWMDKSVKWVRRHPARALLASVAALGAIAAIVGLSWHNSVLADELARTKRLADHGSEFSQWLIQEHLTRLATIPGTTEVRHKVTDRIRMFLDASFDDMPTDARYTRRLGYSYSRLASIAGGTDQNNLGDLNEAEANYLKSLLLYDRAFVQEPGSEILARLRVDSYLSLVDVYREMHLPEKSNRYLELARNELVNVKDNTWETRFLRIQLLDTEVEKAMEDHDPASALMKLDRIDEQLSTAGDDAIESEVENQRIWVAGNRGMCLESLGRLDEAERSFREAVEIARRSMEEDPADALRQRRYSTTLVQLGDNQFSQGRADDALENFNAALKIVTRLAELDTTSVDLAINCALKHSRVSSALQYVGKLDEADRHITEAIAISRRLEKQGKSSVTLLRNLEIDLLSSAAICVARKNPEKARRLLDEHRELCESILKREPEATIELNQLAESHFQRAVMLIGVWTKEDFDPASARQSEPYLEIVTELDRSLFYFDEVFRLAGPAWHAKQFRNKVVEVRNVLESFIDQLIEDRDAGSATREF